MVNHCDQHTQITRKESKANKALMRENCLTATMCGKKRITIKPLSFVLTIIIILLLLAGYCFTKQEASSVNHNFKKAIKAITSDFDKGKYGEELFYLASNGPGSYESYPDIAVYRTKNDLKLYIAYRGYSKVRDLSYDEHTQFLEFIKGKDVDSLNDFKFNIEKGKDVGSLNDFKFNVEADCAPEYQYLHYANKEKLSSVYIFAPYIPYIPEVTSPHFKVGVWCWPLRGILLAPPKGGIRNAISQTAS